MLLCTTGVLVKMLHRDGQVFAAACALFFVVALGQQTTPVPPTLGPVPCDELATYSRTYHDCVTYSNCSGTQCNLMQQLAGSTAKFWVEEKCADPVMIDLSVDGPESSPMSGYRARFSVGGDGLHAYEPNSISADYGRNASHLTFQAITLVEGDIAIRLIPEITIPLHPRQCMCQSMRQAASIIRFPTQIPFFNLGLTCSARPDCVGIHCNITIGDLRNYVADITIDPCGETMRVVVNDSSNVTQLDRVYRDSGSYNFDIPLGATHTQATLFIGMLHYNYSMNLTVTLRIPLLPGAERILPSRKIILDRSHCANLTYYYENRTSAATTTEGSHPVTTVGPPIPSNCLKTNAPNCNVIGNCTGLMCSVQQSASTARTMASVQIKERCADPVKVNASIGPSYQHWFSVGGDGLGTDEDVNGDRVRVEYGRNTSHLHFKAMGSQSTLIPEVHIPLYPRPCMCQSMDDIATSIRLDRLPIPSEATPSCSRLLNCSGVSCGTTGSVTTQVIVDPCEESVRIVVRNTNGDTNLDQSFPKSGEYTVPGSRTIQLFVGIENHNFSMKLSIRVTVNGVAEPIEILSPHKIILDRTNCARIKYYFTDYTKVTTGRPPSPSPSGGGSQPSPPTDANKHSAPLSLVVGVPFGILLVLAVGLLVAIATVLVLWRLRKRKRAYSFQRVTFNEIDDDEKD